ncbi:MAG: hypothetical protein KDB79_14380 [Acidobacteria bacterium]|nr:hypothetical protein [Acidobacteriota bacterium]
MDKKRKLLIKLLPAAILIFATDIQARPDLAIAVARSHGWGNASTRDIQKVLESVADELLENVSSVGRLSIIVRFDARGPRTLYKREKNGEFIVWLNVVDRRWAQFSYQFGHELSHILTINQKNTTTPNQWFEESLGETASLFAMRRMADTWSVTPPYENWRSYSGSLRTYIDEQYAEEHRKLPPGTSFKKWFKANEPGMRADPYLRDKDELAANQLLAYFENYAGSWDAVTYLNRSNANSSQSFKSYLENWYRNAPSRHKPFIREIGNLFGKRIR